MTIGDGRAEVGMVEEGSQQSSDCAELVVRLRGPQLRAQDSSSLLRFADARIHPYIQSGYMTFYSH